MGAHACARFYVYVYRYDVFYVLILGTSPSRSRRTGVDGAVDGAVDGTPGGAVRSSWRGCLAFECTFVLACAGLRVHMLCVLACFCVRALCVLLRTHVLCACVLLPVCLLCAGGGARRRSGPITPVFVVGDVRELWPFLVAG